MSGSTAFSLADLQQLAERFAEEHLSDYTEELRGSDRKFARKEINDALWGTIALTAAEIAILDSPLLQRLRYVRQLGVVHWVYPGALHTRFEHTIGVLYQTQNLISALNTLPNSESQVINNNYIQILRICALLHDIGHAAFSHVSELAVESLPESNLIKAEFALQLQMEGKQLSEIFAYFVIRSASMRRLFEVIVDRCGSLCTFDPNRELNLTTILEKISDAIIGRTIDSRVPLLHEIISGPFDADKLDYFTRDARLAGTPSVLDISRLVQKITIRALDSSELPNEIASQVTRIDEKHYLFGVKWSGVAVLDELHLARVLLYAKIYRHPKVIAIEQMLRAAILTLAKITPIMKIIELLYSCPDDALLGMSEKGLAAAIELDLPNADAITKARLSHVVGILQAIKNRRLWVKAFQIQRRYPADPLETEESQKHGLVEFREDLEHPQKRRQFVEDLLTEVARILAALDVPADSYATALESSVMVHALGQTPGGTQITRAYLIPTTGKPIPFREYTVNRMAWAEAYLSDQPIGFIFATPDMADVVYIATEKLIRTQYEVRLPPSAMEVSKRQAGRIQDLKKRLAGAGYYRGTPFDVRPALMRMQRADVPEMISQFERIRSGFQEPPSINTSSLPGAQNRTEIWLRQFDNDQHVECAMKLLRHFKLLTRQDTSNAIRDFVTKNPEFMGARIVPLGGVKDSGAIQTYYAADQIGPLVSACMSLEEACHGQKYPVIFIDDFLGSGGQVTDVLAAGFGNPDDRKALGEQRDLFSGNVQEYLHEVKIGFVFTAAWDSGMQALNDYLTKLQLDFVLFRLLTEKEIPFAFENCTIDVSAEMMASFRNRCTEIGQSILRNPISQGTEPVPVMTEEKILKRGLGYGNRAMLLATPYNVPTQTLTAIWGTGIVDEIPWLPLMSRRKKT